MHRICWILLKFYSNILSDDSVLVSFDIADMFPSIDNVSGLEAVPEILENRETYFPPAECFLEAFELCLECNNSVFNEKFSLQEDGTAIVPHMSCSYIVTFLCVGLIWRPWVTYLRSCIGKGLEMISLQYGITIYKNFKGFLNLWIALIQLLEQIYYVCS